MDKERADDMRLDETDAKLCYAILKLQNSASATQKDIATNVGVHVSTISRRVRRLIAANIVVPIDDRLKSIFSYEINSRTQIDTQDSARIALELISYPKDDQNCLEIPKFIRHLSGLDEIIMLAPKDLAGKLRELASKGDYVELIGTKYIKVLPKTLRQEKYLELVAAGCGLAAIRSYEFGTTTA